MAGWLAGGRGDNQAGQAGQAGGRRVAGQPSCQVDQKKRAARRHQIQPIASHPSSQPASPPPTSGPQTREMGCGGRKILQAKLDKLNKLN